MAETEQGKTTYHDPRETFWRRCFEQAVGYDEYLECSGEKRAGNWRSLGARIPALTPEQTKRLTRHGRELNVLLVSGAWCGDCVRQGPMVHQLAEAAGATVRLRVIDRDEIPALRDEIRLLGAARVPVAVFLSEDFHEVGRFGDRTLHTYRRKAETELGAACAVPSAELSPVELACERDEWLDVLERMLLMVRLAPPLRARHND